MTRFVAVPIRRVLAYGLLAGWLLACGGSGGDPGADDDGGADGATDAGAVDGGGPADGGGAPDGGGADAGNPDGSIVDAGAMDGGALDGGARDDAALPDAGVDCDPSAVDFPTGGSLEEGQFCDEVFVCAEDTDETGRIEDASDRFVCEEHEGGSFCSTAYRCAYRGPGSLSGPGELEPDEIEHICRITVLEPTPPITCVVYL